MFDMDCECQGYGVRHLPFFYSMANINLYKVILEHFSLALTVFEIFTFQIRDLGYVGQGQDLQHWHWPHPNANT